MKKRFPPPRGSFWIFAYGSLLWSPGFRYAERRSAVLNDYHRALCIYSWVYRGTNEAPGLVFALERGGRCQGAAYRVRARDAQRVYDYIYAREMPTAVYHPVWADCILTSGPKRRVKALTFVADPSNKQYAGRLDKADVLRLIGQGKGSAGTCQDYVTNTSRHLRELGIRDRWLEGLVANLVGYDSDRKG